MPIALVGYFVFALVTSFCCSLFEATLLSTPPAHIERLAREGKRSGRILVQLRARLDRSLIAILTLNTVANMFGAAGVGNEAGKLARAAGHAEAETLAVQLASIALTLAILVFAEIVPKTLGATYARALAGPIALPLRGLVLLLTPIVSMLSFVPRLVTRRGSDPLLTREDLAMTVELAQSGGALPLREHQVITNMLALEEARVRDVLTPRVEHFALSANATAASVNNEHPVLRFSRIPVASEADTFVGLVLRSSIYEACLRGRGDATIGSLAQPIRFIPETKRLASLLEEFLARREHVCLVVDERGAVEGLVTMEDVMERLLGVQIVDELDAVTSLRARARARALRLRERPPAP